MCIIVMAVSTFKNAVEDRAPGLPEIIPKLLAPFSACAPFLKILERTIASRWYCLIPLKCDLQLPATLEQSFRQSDTCRHGKDG
ncbi:hypothetical protein CQ009_22290 [Pseudomonas sp. MYb2]|nr:hypothetical protein AK821_26495 [Pseudomonas sp. RIT-PI-r]PRB45639.1 hypothetical protein CQ025_23065 [Pseudomonas sp. MYb3]PRC31565.1 hypothetical protein CQ009_22290 [Pseudomonas sp. MYb2]